MIIFTLILVSYMSIEFIYFLLNDSDVRFKNDILNLDLTDKDIEYFNLDFIKDIYINSISSQMKFDDLSEYSIKNIDSLLRRVRVNISQKDIKYYHRFIILKLFTIFFKKPIMNKESRNKLNSLISNILKEIDKERYLFGLNTKEKSIFTSLINSTSLTKIDQKSISELKSIITDRYQELVIKEEKSEKASKRATIVGLIGLFLGIVGFIISLIPYFKDIQKFFN